LKSESNNNRYYLIARNLSYTDYIKLKDFLIQTRRLRAVLLWNKKQLGNPIGKIAERTIGYERKTPAGTYDVKGLNGRTGNIKWKRW
jgi:cell division protein FtsI (penicillin-binding protein 3)